MSNPYQANPNKLSIDPAKAGPVRMGMPNVGMIYSDPNLYKMVESQFDSELDQALSRPVAKGQTQPIWMRRLLSKGENQISNASNASVHPYGGNALGTSFPTDLPRPDLSLYSLREAPLMQARSQAYETPEPSWGDSGLIRFGPIHSDAGSFMPVSIKTEFPSSTNHPFANRAAGQMGNLGPSHFVPSQIQTSNVNSDHANVNPAGAMMMPDHIRNRGASHFIPNQLQISNVNFDHDLTLLTGAQGLNAPTLNQSQIPTNLVPVEPESKDLMSLPNEILYNIQSLLDHPSLLQLSATNKFFRSMCSESKIKQSLLWFEKCSLLDSDNLLARKTLLPCYSCFKALPASNHFPEVENGGKYNEIEMASENAGRRTCATCLITKHPDLIWSFREQHDDWLFQDYGWSSGKSKIFGARHNHSQHDNGSSHYWIQCPVCQFVKRYAGAPYGRRRRYDEALLEGDMCADCYQHIWDEENEERRVKKNTKAKLRYKEKKLEAKRRKEEAEEAKKAGRHFDSAMMGLGMSRFFQVQDTDTSRQSQEWSFGNLSDDLMDTDFDGGPFIAADDPYWA